MLLEIEVDGARQVVARHPDATVVLLVPPSLEVQEARLRGRGDDDAHVARRLAKGQEEIAAAKAFATDIVVNDDLNTAVAEVAGIVERLRSARRNPPSPTTNED